jgi:hypothetical protein
MKRIFAALLFILLLGGIAFSEYTGIINITGTPANITTVTGLFGNTIQYCNVTADCIDTTNYKCFVDSDGNSSGTWQGWCNSSAVTSCFINNSAFVTGTKICETGTSYRTCSNGVWSTATSCGVNETCSSGNCTSVSNATTSSSSSGGTTSVNGTAYYSIKINKTISNFNLVQNTSVLKNVTVKNDGNRTLFNVTLAMTGIESSWYSITPSKHDYIYKDNLYNFTINFSIPHNAEVKSYTITIGVTTSNTSVRDTKTFTLKVLPSNITTETSIKPKYAEYRSLLESIRINITDLESKGYNVTELKIAYGSIESKLNQTNTTLNSGDYFNATLMLDEVKTMLDDMSGKLAGAQMIAEAEQPQAQIDITFIIIVIIIIAVAVVIAYLFWPEKKERSLGAGYKWKPETKKEFKKSEKISSLYGEEGFRSKLSKLFKREKKQKKGEAVKYEFKK